MTEPVIRGVDQDGRAVEIPRQKWIEEMLPRALEQAASDPAQAANLISFALQQGAAAAVLDAAKKLSRADADRVRGRNLYGAALASLERFDEAEKELENLLVFAGDDPTALANLAQVKARKGEMDAAADFLRRALVADPNHAGAFDVYAQNARRRNGETGFLTGCRELAKDPRAWRARVWLARARLGLGETDSAIALYREAMPSASTDGEALAQISADLANAGHLAEAAEIVGPAYRAVRHGPNVMTNLVRILARLGRVADARKLLDEGRQTFGPPWKAPCDALEAELNGSKVGPGSGEVSS